MLVTAGYDAAAERVGRALGVADRVPVSRALGPPARDRAAGDSVVVPPSARVFAVAGIARPERFFADLAAAGWQVAGTMTFRDHHRVHASATSRASPTRRARPRRADRVTTEKDAVRLDGLRPRRRCRSPPCR